MNTESILILGYGNPGREDDALGPEFTEKIACLALPGVVTDTDYQLNIEHAAQMKEYEKVIFADAGVDVEEPFMFQRAKASKTIAFTSHSVSPDSLLAICQDSFGHSPEAWVLAIRGYRFELKEGMSERALENLERAVEFIQTKIMSWKE